jgi:hypothetical protein
MIWPSPETATVLIFAGTLDLPQRSPNVADARLSPFTEPETASPEKPTIFRRDGVRVEHIRDVVVRLSIGVAEFPLATPPQAIGPLGLEYFDPGDESRKKS